MLEKGLEFKIGACASKKGLELKIGACVSESGPTIRRSNFFEKGLHEGCTPPTAKVLHE